MPNGPWFPHPDTFLAPDFRGLPVGVWEIGNTASDHFPGRPRGAQLSGSHHLVTVPLGGFGAAGGRRRLVQRPGEQQAERALRRV